MGILYLCVVSAVYRKQDSIIAAVATAIDCALWLDCCYHGGESLLWRILLFSAVVCCALPVTPILLLYDKI